MRTRIARALVIYSLLAGCATSDPATEDRAKILARLELDDSCKTIYKGDCEGVQLVKAGIFGEQWLVEYENEMFIFSATVGADGVVEMGRMKRN